MTGNRSGVGMAARHGGLLLALLCALMVSIMPSAAYAEDEEATPESSGSTWMVQPSGPDGPNDRSYFVYAMDPGQQVEDTIRITNISEEPLTLGLLATDAFNVPETGAFDLLPTAEQPVDVGAWVTLPVTEVAIEPGNSVDVPFQIQVPDNATPGDHVGGVVTSLTSPGTDADGNEVLFDARIAVRLYLTVSGELTPRLAVEDLAVDYGSNGHQLTGDVTVTYTVRNRGNVRLAADETVSLTPLIGGSVAEQTGDIAELLPGGAVLRSVVLEDVPALVRLQANVQLDPIDVGERLESEPKSITTSTSFWAMPWIPLAVLLVIVLGVYFLMRGRRRRWKAMKAELAEAKAKTSGADQADEAKVGASGDGVGDDSNVGETDSDGDAELDTDAEQDARREDAEPSDGSDPASGEQTTGGDEGDARTDR
ncbi:WxL protein peptidoglycan domain-containing protein [Cumulibacter soli]|uniref:WxL protein peptidoglycan domain-containing protein n=1 Tax=Cumulibacter soli TaxID=2546344 RepID=UPI001067DF63|nr:DUF916 domain-containing protein [Cumulibacter soli]